MMYGAPTFTYNYLFLYLTVLFQYDYEARESGMVKEAVYNAPEGSLD